MTRPDVMSDAGQDAGQGCGRARSLHGRILKGVGGNYRVLLDSGAEITAKPRGILRKEHSVPYPGDWADLTLAKGPENQYTIDHIQERKSFLIRPAIANLDMILLTFSAVEPQPDLLLLDKLTILCRKSGIEPVLCITKADLSEREADRIDEQYAKAGIGMFLIGRSAAYDAVVETIRERIAGKTVSFAGPSGAGKSSLLNRILQKDCMDTGQVSERIGRGRHTTRHSQIFRYRMGFLADTPGFSLLELQDLQVNGRDVLAGYPEIAEIDGKCRFADCRHIGEAGCALDENAVDPGRLARYRQLRIEMDKIQPFEMKKNRNGVRHHD